MIIAIDGPAASGKGTLAKRLAAHFGLPHLDSGLLYRAVAKRVLDAGQALDDVAPAAAAAGSLKLSALNEPLLRGHDLGEAASIIAAIPAVREALRQVQRDFARNPLGAVLDGRDIGTVIAPFADVKIFVTASAEERARRRAAELTSQGAQVDEARILADILRRDQRDRSRPVSPLGPAADAHLLDTTHLDIDAAVRAAIDIVEAARAR
jgi:cytidylate kinase